MKVFHCGLNVLAPKRCKIIEKSYIKNSNVLGRDHLIAVSKLKVNRNWCLWCKQVNYCCFFSSFLVYVNFSTFEPQYLTRHQADSKGENEELVFNGKEIIW